MSICSQKRSNVVMDGEPGKSSSNLRADRTKQFQGAEIFH